MNNAFMWNGKSYDMFGIAMDDDTKTSAAKTMESLPGGENRTHFEGLGDAWGVLTGQNPGAIMSQIIGTVLHAGATRSVWQWQREGRDYVLMAWPQDQPARAAVLMAGEVEQKLSPVTAVPLLDGVPNDLTVEEVRPWAQGNLANVAVSVMEGENPLYLFPTEDFEFSNGDNTFYGYVKVVDDLSVIDEAAIRAEVAAYKTLIYPTQTFAGGEGGAPSCH